jgi:hypothetical protein
MGRAGLLLTALGTVVFLVAQRRIQIVTAEALVARSPAAARRLERVNWALLPIAVAIAICVFARELGQGVAGLYVCETLLVLNAAIFAALRIRWFAELEPPRPMARSYRASSVMQMGAAWTMFIGCALYLLRP